MRNAMRAQPESTGKGKGLMYFNDDVVIQSQGPPSMAIYAAEYNNFNTHYFTKYHALVCGPIGQCSVRK